MIVVFFGNVFTVYCQEVVSWYNTLHRGEEDCGLWWLILIGRLSVDVEQWWFRVLPL